MRSEYRPAPDPDPIAAGTGAQVVRVRVWMPDRPGALGAVASRIGSLGGDLVGIEIVERGAGRAIDDLSLSLPTPVTVDLLVREILEVDGVQIEEVHRLDPGQATDGRIMALRSALEIAAAPDRTALWRAVGEVLARDLDCRWSAVVVGGSVAEATAGAPDSAWLVAFSAGCRSAGDDRVTSSTEGVAGIEVPGGDTMLVTGRPERPFHERERSCLALLADLVGTRIGSNPDPRLASAPSSEHHLTSHEVP